MIPNPKDETPVRPHVFDGIQEYDHRLPNWWLWTLYGAIVYSFGYWIVGHFGGAVTDPGGHIDRQLATARAAAAKSAAELTDAKLWAFSRDSATVSAGRDVFLANCAACHRPDLQGQIGPNLADTAWLHGGNPMAVFKTVGAGILEKGMPAWSSILGTEKITQAVAFIYSHHQEGEPVTVAPPWVATIPGAPAAEAK
jgi:cytochrome c oxidase cbb3-type subunit 3